MKKKLLTIGILLTVLTMSYQKSAAQTVTGTVALNIVLADAFSIVLGPTPEVTFTYATAADYASSKTIAKANHFTVISNKPYSVAVKANSTFNTISSTTPALSAVQIAVDPSTASGATYNNATLSTANQVIAAAATPTIGTAYNINYSIPSAAPLLTLSTGTYTTNVVYTVTQP